MTYLIARLVVLLLLAAGFGFLFGRWWVRRSFVDVSESYETISAAASDAPWNKLWAKLDEVNLRVDNLPKPEKPVAVDFGPTHQRIERLEAAIANLPKPEKPVAVDFGPTHQRIERIEAAIANLPKPEKPTEEFGQVISKLQLIDAQVSRLAKPSEPKRTGPRLLRSASHGEKDDLKQISGVGPKLEKLLNKNGVYYFWQIAEWKKRDIKAMDERLDAFNGRISRDQWVSQAARLMQSTPSAAKRPADDQLSAATSQA